MWQLAGKIFGLMFGRSPVDDAERTILQLSLKWAGRVRDLLDTPEAKIDEQTIIACLKTIGATVTVDPVTKRLVDFSPPTSYVAPARQSPTDFNLHSAGGTP